MLDVLFMLYYLARPLSFIAKAELFRVPVVGKVLTYGRTIPIERTNRAKAIKSIELAQKYTSEGRSIVIAPEGTRRRKMSDPDQPNILPLKKGGFHLAKNAGIRIIPLVFVGVSRISPDVASFNVNKGDVYCQVLEPISAEEVEKLSVDELIERTRNHMLDSNVCRSNDEILKPDRDVRLYCVGYVAFLVSFFWILKIVLCWMWGLVF